MRLVFGVCSRVTNTHGILDPIGVSFDVATETIAGLAGSHGGLPPLVFKEHVFLVGQPYEKVVLRTCLTSSMRGCMLDSYDFHIRRMASRFALRSRTVQQLGNSSHPYARHNGILLFRSAQARSFHALLRAF
jgi:hypothetical protein